MALTNQRGNDDDDGDDYVYVLYFLEKYLGIPALLMEILGDSFIFSFAFSCS